MKTILTTLGVSLLVLAGCTGQKQAESNFIQENIDNAVAQETIQTDIIEKSRKGWYTGGWMTMPSPSRVK